LLNSWVIELLTISGSCTDQGDYIFGADSLALIFNGGKYKHIIQV